MTRLRHVLRLNPSRGKHGAPATAGEVTFAPMEALKDGVGGLDVSRTGASDALSQGSYNFFADGDVLLAKVTPCFENGKKALASGLHNGVGFATSEVLVLRPDTRRIDPRYLIHLLSSSSFKGAGMATMTGAGGLRRISEDAVKNFRLPTAGIDVQRALAQDLDREVQRIESLVARKQALLTLLDARLNSLIYTLVTRGSGQSAETVATGLDSLPQVPAHWSLRRIATLFRESTASGESTLPILSITIAGGVSDRELGDDDRDRVVNRIADRSTYKTVRPGDLAYNMMRAWQGAIGVVSVSGAVSPAYVVATPRTNLHPPFFEALLRTPAMIEEMRRASRGITEFRRRLYWQDFKQIIVPVPPMAEQIEVADRIASEQSRVDAIRSAVRRSIELLRERHTSAIEGAINGTTSASPAHQDKSSCRTLVAAEIVYRHRTMMRFGRVKLQKLLYLAETHVGIGGLNGRYQREAAGPLDRAMLDDVEGELLNRDLYRKDGSDGGGITYAALSRAGQHVVDLQAAIPDKVADLRALIDLVRDLDTRATEMVTTLYAVWNDDLLDGRQISDDAIVEGVLDDWHPEKRAKFTATDLHHWLAWMKRNGLIPRGNGPRTIETMPKDLFAGSGSHGTGERR